MAAAAKINTSMTTHPHQKQALATSIGRTVLFLRISRHYFSFFSDSGNKHRVLDHSACRAGLSTGMRQQADAMTNRTASAN